jgi:hypothetical protein
MIEGSGSGSIPLTMDPDPGGPKTCGSGGSGSGGSGSESATLVARVSAIFKRTQAIYIKLSKIQRYLKVLSSHLNWGARLDSFDPL